MKKVGQKVAAGAIVAAFLGGTVAGGVTMNEMMKISDARNAATNLRTRAQAHSSYSQMVRERDQQVWDAYNNGVIGSNEFTQQMTRTHSEENVFDNRYQLLSKEDAIAWEEARADEDKYMSGMVTSAITGGVLLGIGAWGCINKGHKLMKAAEEAEDEDEDIKIFGE